MHLLFILFGIALSAFLFIKTSNFWWTVIGLVFLLLPVVGFLPGPVWIGDKLRWAEVVFMPFAMLLLIPYILIVLSKWFIVLYFLLVYLGYRFIPVAYRYKAIFALAIALLIGMPYDWPLSRGALIRITRPSIIEKSQICIDKIEEYYKENGVYPEKISDIRCSPNFNQMGRASIDYRKSGDSYKFILHEGLIGFESHIWTIYCPEKKDCFGDSISGYPNWHLGVTVD